MIVLGLTGSIGMGKSTAARLLRSMGVPVNDADATIHALMAPGGAAVAAVEAAFPGVRAGDAIDRTRLRARVKDDPAAFRRLEAILHPLARRASRRFLARHARAGRRLVVLDIPLLFESKSRMRVDYVVVVSAPRFLQEARVLRRPGMTRAWFETILSRQMPDRLKRRRADFLVMSALGRHNARKGLAAALRALRHRRGRRRRAGAALDGRG